MKLYTTLPTTLRPAFEAELAAYRQALAHHDLRPAWAHLERAHILGQRYPFAHSRVHGLMLRFGIRIKSTREVLGQLPRLIFGGLKSFVGTVPIGNPGGANVPPLKLFPIPADLQAVFVKAGMRP